MGIPRRRPEIVVISDVHLGTRGCRASELHAYLKSIEPKTLILNGDIIDIWQFRKNYWPPVHMKIVKQIIAMAARKTKIYYITGNHDEMLRRFNGFSIGNLHIVNQLSIDLEGENTWFFHGDVFDVVMQYSKWLAKLGAIGYDSLIWLNTNINSIRTLLKLEKVSFSKKVKENVKSAVKYINDFEVTAAGLAARKGYSAIVCGHIHHPEIKTISTAYHDVKYLNSGDWIENLTALEYESNKGWTLFDFRLNGLTTSSKPIADDALFATDELKANELFALMVKEFNA
ncbi:MAG TPA: UDP-2,3-diacylglucosamine diphosphatase [Bacteroidales bacterium]|nr:UDP-2,3-diacylglucosamine diphosphatase [Bacteroidales bacterium]